MTLKIMWMMALTAVCVLIVPDALFARKYDSYRGFVMCGYQGWGGAPDDGAGRGWGAYAGPGGEFRPGCCSIDFWPATDEYEKTYATPFKHADGAQAVICSPYDASTVDTHFRWMKEAGIDGVFLQRFVTHIRPDNPAVKAHFDQVLDNAVRAAQRYGRAVCVMYDLTGLREGDAALILDDWRAISDKYGFYDRAKGYDCYLHHNGRPLVALWGVGFADRPYDYTVPGELVRALTDSTDDRRCSVHLGVPAYWRTAGPDVRQDSPEELLALAALSDVIHPWTPGRYRDSEGYERYLSTVAADLAWAEARGKDYAACVFPGFSWHNKALSEFPDEVHPTDAIPREGGRFLWMQLAGAVNAGAPMIYVAMFDEIEEGTAIYKLSGNPPVGFSPFVPLGYGTPPDHYMWLAGQAALALRKGQKLSADMPSRDK
ncbi:MAG: xylosidase [Rikenellaceae bacterium]|nr:xylosidase [Rikenellaceae bacterium]